MTSKNFAVIHSIGFDVNKLALKVSEYPFKENKNTLKII